MTAAQRDAGMPTAAYATSFALLLMPATALPAVQRDGLANWNYEALQDDLHITDLLRQDVQSEDARRIGRIRDVLIDDDGNFEAVIVSFDHASQDASALALMAWSDAGITPGESRVTLSVGQQEDAAGNDGSSTGQDPENGLRARKLVGLPVHLKGAEAFGEVDDILVDPLTRQPSALLVTSSGNRSYALPLEPEGISAEGEYVAYDYTAEQVRALGEFEAR